MSSMDSIITFFGSHYNISHVSKASIVIEELLYTSGFALVSVLILSLIFMSHPSGAIFVTMSVSMIFVELVGLLRVGGVYINSVTTVVLVMAIGLSVDFVMHVVMAYFETTASTRDGKVCIAMMTIGTSILVAGCSTLLGTMLLAFGSSKISYIFFSALFGVVALGLGHGLILLPVVLSFIGPLVNPDNPSFRATPSIIKLLCSRFFPNN